MKIQGDCMRKYVELQGSLHGSTKIEKVNNFIASSSFHNSENRRLEYSPLLKLHTDSKFLCNQYSISEKNDAV